MEVRPIKSEDEYNRALAELEEVFDAPSGTQESDKADLLAILIDDFESRNYPIEAPDPIAAIKIRMEEMQLKQVDLASDMGGENRVSEVLSRKRRLTLEMIRRLTEKLNLSASLLIGDYELE